MDFITGRIRKMETEIWRQRIMAAIADEQNRRCRDFANTTEGDFTEDEMFDCCNSVIRDVENMLKAFITDSGARLNVKN